MFWLLFCRGDHLSTESCIGGDREWRPYKERECPPEGAAFPLGPSSAPGGSLISSSTPRSIRSEPSFVAQRNHSQDLHFNFTDEQLFTGHRDRFHTGRPVSPIVAPTRSPR